MKTVKMGEREVGLRASPLSLIFYQQAFGKDMLAEITKLESMEKAKDGDISGLDTVLLLRFAYALARTAAKDSSFSHFEAWVDDLGSHLFADLTWMATVVEVISEEFFRTGETVT